MIGVFDSGVGGLTVVKEIFKELPQYQIIYFGDTARLPYGTKGADFVKRYSKKITEWLLNRGARIIVVACNTSSAWAADFLKKEFPAIPIFEMITPAVKEVISIGKNRVGIIGTPGTIKSGVYDEKLKGFKIYKQSCPLFVPMVEEGLVSGKLVKDIAENYLLDFEKEKIDALVLGCTHYPLLEKTIAEIMGEKTAIINPAKALAKDLKEFLKDNSTGARKDIEHQFFFSDEPYNFEKISHLCFNKKLDIKVGDPF